MGQSFAEWFYPETRFGGFTDIDGTIAFLTRVNALVEESFEVLDVGCGRGAQSDDRVLLRKNLRNLRGKVSRVTGIDVDEVGETNPFLDEFRQITEDRWPVEDNSVDLIICENVLEHLENPAQFFSEVQRVLKEKGYLCIRTPNKWSYVAIISRLVPNRFHAQVVKTAQETRKSEDVFPTFYRINTIRSIRSTMKKHGLEPAVYGYEAEPSYFAFSKFCYAIGVLHQKFAPNFLKPAIFAFGRKR